MKRYYCSFVRLLSGVCVTCCAFSGLSAQTNPSIPVTREEARAMYSTMNSAWTSVHDPSIVYEPQNRQYYVFGSHVGVSKTADLRNWTGVAQTWAAVNEAGTVTNNVTFNEAFHIHQTKEVTIGGVPTAFGNYDAAGWNCALPGKDANGNPVTWTVAGNMWAPDVIWNPTMGKWCQYLSLNGPEWNSCIILLTADRIEGPYLYQGPVVFTGFRNDTDERISFHKTDLELVIGKQTALPARYNKTNWGDFWPHAIDPAVFFDEEGVLWMVYGSWSGGIYMLQLNAASGLRDYDVAYPGDYDTKGAQVTSDPYFGKKVAGGRYVSGEGPYIEHIGNYYYLFMSYGGFDPNAGYEMRVFRSERPDGPYKDASGRSAIFSNWVLNFGPNSDTRGEKIMGAYNHWGFMTVGECAQGHNSVLAAEDGNTYLVYHTKFNDGTFGHQVRVHQLFLNADGWPVAAPFEYGGETFGDKDVATTEAFTTAEIAGIYKVLLHKYGMNHTAYEEVTPMEVTLRADGSVTGAYTGSWSHTAGSSYITLTLGNTIYKGVVTEQQMEPTTIKALCFTACSTGGVNVWGYRMEDRYALAYALNNAVMPVANNQTVNKNVDLYGVRPDASVTLKWRSDRPDIISNTGRYNPMGLTENTPVTLTAEMVCGDYYCTEDYRVTARKYSEPSGDWQSGLRAYYGFDMEPYVNAYTPSQQAVLLAESSNSKPALEQDSIRTGNVLHQYFGASGHCSYVRMPNPLRDLTLEGMTVSMWVKRTDDVPWDAVWSFYNGAANTRLYMTGNTYVGFNNGSDWFDINHPGSILSDNIPVGEWTLVTLTVSRTYGCYIYINGSYKRSLHFAGTCNGAEATDKDFDYGKVMDFIRDCPYFFLGYGSFWGSVDVRIDDVMIYDRELSGSDIRALNTVCNRVTDLGGATTGVRGIGCDPQQEDGRIYDLSGRRMEKAGRGVYIINGRKRLNK